jgi:hypothetical protein
MNDRDHELIKMWLFSVRYGNLNAYAPVAEAQKLCGQRRFYSDEVGNIAHNLVYGAVREAVTDDWLDAWRAGGCDVETAVDEAEFGLACQDEPARNLDKFLRMVGR